MADSRIKSVSELLSAFFDQETVRKGELYSGFGHSWKAIAGTRLGEHSRPVDIRHGILIVETEHQGWMQLLQIQQDRILEETRKRFPDLGIGGIAFRLGNSGTPAAAPAQGPTWLGTAPPNSRPEREPAEAPEGPPSGAPEDGAKGAKAGKETGKESGKKVGREGELPSDLVDMFARIRKNIGK